MKSEVASGPKRIGRAATVIAIRFARQVRPAEKFNCCFMGGGQSSRHDELRADLQTRSN